MDKNRQFERQPEGKETAAAHQEGLGAVRGGQVQKREKSTPEKNRPKPNDANKHKRSASDNDMRDIPRPEDEPGPDDDDGLPEDTRRRVPS